MQNKAIPAFLPLSPSKAGVLYLVGYGTSLRVDAGMLVVRSVVQGRIREGRFAKVDRPQLRRLVVQGKGGWATLEALSWVRGIGGEFLFLALNGDVIATSGHRGVDLPALRRAQALASTTLAGLEAARYLIGEKITGQRGVIETSGVPPAEQAMYAMEGAITGIAGATSLDQLRGIESQAAAAFWSALAPLPVRFGRPDEGRTPKHWRTIGPRASAITGHPRTATTAAHALWNYLYRLAEFEATLACLGAGLDPGVGIVHTDQPSRDSMALDLMEAVRPAVDAFVVRMLADRVFRKRDFVELPNGAARLTPALARMLAETLPRWRHAAAPAAERVAKMLAASSRSRLRVPTKLTQDARSWGREGIRRGPRRVLKFRRGLPPACRSCGLILEVPGRALCDECLSETRRTNAEASLKAGRATMTAMRAKGVDPRARPEARRKVGEANVRRQREAKAWDRENERPDPKVFRREILPALQHIPTSQLALATGLSLPHCAAIRRGLRVPHPRHWEALREITSKNQPASSSDRSRS